MVSLGEGHDSAMNNAEGTTADIVVIGGGGAGLAAAVEAARYGAQVVLLEKNPKLGGTTVRSVGSITAARTSFQAKAGVEDTPDEHFEDLALFNDLAVPNADSKDNLALRRLLVENTADTIDFLMDLGIEFFGPMPETPHRKPRMHNVLPHARAYIHHLNRHARMAGVDIRVDAKAERLLTEGGRVIGAEATLAGTRRRFLARRGVILAAGDYSASQEMKANYVTPDLADIEGINPTSTGDGQRLALEAGAEIVNGDVMLGPEIRFVAPPRKALIEFLPPSKPVVKFVKFSIDHMPSWLLRPFLMMFVTTNLAPSHNLFQEGAILVNRSGRRFADELDKPQYQIPKQPGRLAYILLDDEIARKFTAWPHFISTAPGIAYAYLPDYRRNRKDIYHRASTLAGLAEKLGMPVAELENTVAGYNDSVAGNQEGGPSRPTLKRPPFHALGPAKSWIVMTDGGAKVNLSFEVLDAEYNVIPGLFAAGSNGQGGVLLEGHGHHLGWAFTSGRLAGRNAAVAGGKKEQTTRQPQMTG